MWYKHLGWLEIILEMGCKTRIKLYTLKAIITPRRRNVAAQVAGDLKRSHTLYPSYGGTQKKRKKEKAIIMVLSITFTIFITFAVLMQLTSSSL